MNTCHADVETESHTDRMRKHSATVIIFTFAGVAYFMPPVATQPTHS